MERALKTLEAAMKNRPYFSFAEYIENHPASRSTAWRDFKKLLQSEHIKEIETVDGDMRLKIYAIRSK